MAVGRFVVCHLPVALPCYLVDQEVNDLLTFELTVTADVSTIYRLLEAFALIFCQLFNDIQLSETIVVA
jgi:hypothetical protein